jgi:ribonuclease P protein component
LLKTGEFSSVFNFRKAIKSQHFLLHYRRHLPDESSGPRLGLVIGKRLLSRSVYRNLVKRLAREAFRQMRGQLPAVDIVMRLAAKPGRPDRKLIAAEMQELLQKLANKRNSMKVGGAEQAPKAAAS